MTGPTPPAPPSFQTTYLDKPMGSVGIIAFGLFFVALSLTTIDALIGVWPGRAGAARILWFTLRPEHSNNESLRLLLVAVFSGALGAFVHSATSFTRYLGNRQLVRSWAGWYVLRPFIGMALGLLFYFLIRAGLIVSTAEVAPATIPAGAAGADTITTARTAATTLNPYGIAAIAGLAGMFSKEAIDKLKDVFENLLRPPKDPSADKLQEKPAPEGGPKPTET